MELFLGEQWLGAGTLWSLLNGLDRQYDVLFMNFTGTYRKTFFPFGKSQAKCFQ